MQSRPWLPEINNTYVYQVKQLPMSAW
jgi:hypothetical protein